mmetsp:Transcript_1489/g.3086  ORF Transcript_1489/g.3086 Transcript_1489/m.3086 type:complete len:184 (+) Transcript_1489:341-892(+)
MHRVFETAFEVTKRALPFIPVFVGINDYFGSITFVSGRSMQPTFNARGDGSCDALLLNKLSASWRSYQRGDVIIMRSPTHPTEMLAKRVIAMEGDLICTRDSVHKAIQVPKGHIWVEGDNANNSNDSNTFGPVAAGLVEARVEAKVWPLSEMCRVKRIDPPRDRVIKMESGTQLHVSPWWLNK